MKEYFIQWYRTVFFDIIVLEGDINEKFNESIFNKTF